MKNLIFKPSNELTFLTAQPDINRLVVYLQGNIEKTVYFDLSDVKQCDSAGLALLIEAKRLCKQYQKKLIIEGMPKMIYTLAEFCGVEAILND